MATSIDYYKSGDTYTGPVVKTVTSLNSSNVSAGTSGAASTGTWGFNSGTPTTIISNTATYSEAGKFTLVLEDQDFASVDSADSSTTERYFSGSATLWVFTPDYFTSSVAQACSGGGFTYSGQPFTVTVTGKNLSGSTTQNFDNALGWAQIVNLSDDASGLSTNFSNYAIPASSFGSGTTNYSSVSYAFSTTPTIPTSIAVRATHNTDSTVTSNGHTPGSVALRSGRVRLTNANGSELLPLGVPLFIEYYQDLANGWKTNASDSCTSLSAGNFAFSFPVAAGNNLSACETSITLSGSVPSYTAKLTAPGTGNNGWTDLTLNLGATASGNSCLAGVSGTATTASVPWLQYNWTGSAANPTARATFGVRSSAPVIYRTERY